MKVPISLIRKYNVPGPRYTSYPTAVQFQDLDRAELTHYLAERNKSPRDVSIYLHLPFCASLCWYCGCTTVITRKKEHADDYLDHIESELRHLSKTLHKKHRVLQVHYGGGTPTFLTPEQLLRLGDMLRYYLNIDYEVEFGVEIDPRSFTPEHLDALLKSGMNRASLGFQDVNPEVQKAIHRIQPFEMVQKTMQLLRSAGINSINLDIIYGLPLQTRERFAKTLHAVRELRPDRIAMYSYAHVPWMKPAQKLLKETDLPTPEEKMELLQDGIMWMQQSGFDHIGMDHFARPNDELSIALRDGTLQRNFQGYSTKAGLDLYGLGMSSISSVGKYYFQNEKDLEDWKGEVSRHGNAWTRGYALTREDELRRAVIMQIMCSRHLNYRDVFDKWYVNPVQHFDREIATLEPLMFDDLIEVGAEGIRITSIGRHFLRNIAMCFDQYLNNHTQKPTYSKTV